MTILLQVAEYNPLLQQAKDTVVPIGQIFNSLIAMAAAVAVFSTYVYLRRRAMMQRELFKKEWQRMEKTLVIAAQEKILMRERSLIEQVKVEALNKRRDEFLKSIDSIIAKSCPVCGLEITVDEEVSACMNCRVGYHTVCSHSIEKCLTEKCAGQVIFLGLPRPEQLQE